MDALDLLKSDHERVSSLFGQFKNASPEARPPLFEQIKSTLLMQAHVENTVFYPAFKNYPDFQDAIARSYNDQRAIKKSLDESDGRRPEQVDSLRALFDDHIRREEEELFPMVRKLMKRSEREILGRHLLAAKSEQPSAA